MTLTDLNRHLFIVTQLDEARDRLLSMQESVIRAQTYDAMPHGSGTSDRTGRLAVMIAMQEEDIARLEKAVEKSEDRIKHFIDSIEDSRTRTIFRLRYLCGYDWKAVADVMGDWMSDDACKAACYRYLQSVDVS